MRLLMLAKNGCYVVLPVRPEEEDGIVRVDLQPLVAFLGHVIDTAAMDDGCLIIRRKPTRRAKFSHEEQPL